MLHVARQHMRKNRYQNNQIKFLIGEGKAVLSSLAPAARIVLLVVDVDDLESESWELRGYVSLAQTNTAGNNHHPLIRACRKITSQSDCHSSYATTNIQDPMMRLQPTQLPEVFQVLLSGFDVAQVTGEIQIPRWNQLPASPEQEVDAIPCE